MIETGGLAVLFAWLIFAALLTVLAYFLLRDRANPIDDAKHEPSEPPDVA